MNTKIDDGLSGRRRITLFAHWDPECIVDPYVVHYLEELRKISDIAFYSDCDLPQTELAKIESLCRVVGAGRHKAYDFGSYQKAYQKVESFLVNYDELILANDSCYGPFSPLEELFEKMESDEFDYWGLTEHASSSFGGSQHLQSYFVVMKKAVFQSDCFKSFIAGVKPEADKREVIIKYDVGLSKLLEAEGFKRGSLVAYDCGNVSYDGGALLLVKDGVFPFIKREMLTENPCCVARILRPIKKIAGSSNRDVVKLMLNHLNRFTNGSYGWGWSLLPTATFTIIHRSFFRIKTSYRDGQHRVRLMVFGIRLLWINLPTKRLSHEEIMQECLKLPSDGSK